jgi:hypothetical protein
VDPPDRELLARQYEWALIQKWVASCQPNEGECGRSAHPDNTASLAKLTKYYGSNAHHKLFGLAGIVTMVAVFEEVFWLWYFRQWLIERHPLSKNLATVAFGGGLVLAAGGGMTAGMDFTLSDSYQHMSVTGFQVLNTLQEDLTSGASTAGVAT